MADKAQKLMQELLDVSSKLGVMHRVNTALPKKKAEKFDRIIEQLTTKHTMLRFNFKQELLKRSKNAKV